MQMYVRPAHRDLDDCVQAVQPRVRAHDKASPDWRLGPSQCDLKLIQRSPTGSVDFGNVIHAASVSVVQLRANTLHLRVNLSTLFYKLARLFFPPFLQGFLATAPLFGGVIPHTFA